MGAAGGAAGASPIGSTFSLFAVFSLSLCSLSYPLCSPFVYLASTYRLSGVLPIVLSDSFLPILNPLYQLYVAYLRYLCINSIVFIKTLNIYKNSCTISTSANSLLADLFD